VPLTVVDLPEEAGEFYPASLTLVRPDQHVCWRGDVLPADTAGLVGLVRGHLGSPAK